MSKLRSALVTGATGLVGSALVGRLLSERIQTFCLVRQGSGRKLSSMPSAEVLETASFGVEPLRKSLRSTSCDIVFHLASYGVQVNDRDQDQLIHGNVCLLSHVLQAVSDWPIRYFLFTGSCSEYGTPSRNNVQIAEDEPLRPTSLYGAAKVATELYGSALASQIKIPFVTLRLFNVFGPGEGPHRLLPSIINHLESDRPVALTGGEQQRDLLYVDDVADALLAAACSKTLHPGAAYNVCSGTPVRIREVGDKAANLLNKPNHLLEWGKLPYRADEPMWVVGDPGRFANATSWRPKFTLDAGIRRMIDARRERRDREHQHAV